MRSPSKAPAICWSIARDVATRFAAKAIVGYVTRGKGVAVHAISCPNVVNLMYEPERRIDVAWARDESTPSAYPVKLTVFCDDRYGMLKLITGVIGDAKSNIRNIEARTANSQAVVDIVLDISDLKHLETIIPACARFRVCAMCRGCRRSRRRVVSPSVACG